MVGHSPAAQARKLGLRPGLRLVIDHPPPGWQLAEPPPDLVVCGDDGPTDVAITFVRRRIELTDRVSRFASRIFPDGALWVAWPRRAAGHRSDVTDGAVREAVLPLGLVDVKVAAIDDDWSGLKVVWRRERRS